MRRACAGLVLHLLTAVAVHASDVAIDNWVLLQTVPGESSKVQGNAALADLSVCPASTFKVLITWAALEEGLVKPGTRRLVTDAHVPGAPREVNLTEALFFSSNDYFTQLGKEVGRARLDAYLLRSGLAGKRVTPDWLGSDWSRVEAGGNLKITPRQNHDFMLRLAGGQLASSSLVQADLLAALQWPSADKSIHLQGKTGTAGGAVWFNGFGRSKDGLRVVTVFMPGGIENRPVAIQKFYSVFGLKFDAAWSKNPFFDARN